MSNTFSSKGAAFTRTHEGFVRKYYLDPVGIPTIGIGFTFRSDSFREWWGKHKGVPFEPGVTMSRTEADAALVYLMEREYGKAVNDFLGKRVNQHVFDGACSVVFNLGAGALRWKWATALKKGEYGASAERLRSTGTTAKGKKLKGLVTRRIEEAELIEHGDYTIGGTSKSPKNPAMRRGERGPEVSHIQRILKTIGIYEGEVDGIFGVGTEQAVMEFQTQNDLVVDGWAGSKTLEALKATDSPVRIDQVKPKPKTSKPTHKPSPERTGGIVGAIVALGAIVYAWLKSQGWF